MSAQVVKLKKLKRNYRVVETSNPHGMLRAEVGEIVEWEVVNLLCQPGLRDKLHLYEGDVRLNPEPQRMSIQEAEKLVSERLVKDLLAAGFQLRVENGDGVPSDLLTTEQEALEAMGLADIDTILVHAEDKVVAKGWVRLIYGECGYDLIQDYTCGLSEWLEPIEEFCDQLENQMARV